ncbi:MAG: serine/threonine-protein kinase [Polyangiaceae bacterium]
MGSPDPALAPAFRDELDEANRRRLRVMLPLMVVVHAIHVAMFRTTAAERVALDPTVVRWRDAVAEIHTVSLVVAVVLTAAVFRVKGPAARVLAPLTAAVYLAHGAVVVGADQLTLTSVTPFIGYCLGTAVVLCFPPRVTVTLYAGAAAAFVAVMLVMQPSASARLATMPNGGSIVVVSVALAWMLYLGRRRDFVQRATIEQLNASLERRVAEQVSEIVARADEVANLNAQLQVQVRERSAELSTALAKLAVQAEEGESLRAGSLLGDRFEVGDILGTGGMGAVYSGVDRVTGLRVAIKVTQAGSSQQLDGLRRFLREAQSAATVTHPAVVRTLHVDVSNDGMLYQVQELVEGETLQSRCVAGRPWEPGSVARLVSVLCDALTAAHAQGVVHRDVKPANVMLTRTAPGLKLLDFGIAKLYENAHADDRETTRTGAMLGTPAYMAPEQFDTRRGVTDRVDVYAVGVLLFLLLTGRHPFDGPTPRAMMADHLLTDAPDVRSAVPSVPDALADLAARCLRKTADERPTASSLGKDLAAFADARGVPSLDALERARALRVAGSPRDEPTATVAVGAGRVT